MQRSTVTGDEWADGSAYEAFMGPWSRAAGERFVGWLALPAGQRWLDVGCGTGALSEVLLSRTRPAELLGVDRSAGYVAHARAKLANERARFEVADATALPVERASFDAAVSGLVLNFVPEPLAMLRGMARAVRPGGVVGVYVWDYADGMEMLRRFWDAATALDPAAAALDEGRRFEICRPDALGRAFSDAGLRHVDVTALDVPTRFASFEAYWAPFLGGQGPAPGYARALGEPERTRLIEALRASLRPEPDGTISLHARAWAARGVAPDAEAGAKLDPTTQSSSLEGRRGAEPPGAAQSGIDPHDRRSVSERWLAEAEVGTFRETAGASRP
jgi:SAM-dependent methyltransferase